VFILNNLQVVLNSLESTLTGKGGGGGVPDILALLPSDLAPLSP